MEQPRKSPDTCDVEFMPRAAPQREPAVGSCESMGLAHGVTSEVEYVAPRAVSTGRRRTSV